MKFTNKQIISNLLASQICEVVEDHTMDQDRILMQNIQKIDESHDLCEEFLYALKAEIVQNIDTDLIGYILQNRTSAPLTFDMGVIERFEYLSTLLENVVSEFEDKSNLAMLTSPMFISILQALPTNIFRPAVVGQFKGPNNTMLVGSVDVGENEIDCYSFINEHCDTLFILNKGQITFSHGRNVIEIVEDWESNIITSNYKIESDCVIKQIIMKNLSFD